MRRIPEDAHLPPCLIQIALEHRQLPNVVAVGRVSWRSPCAANARINGPSARAIAVARGVSSCQFASMMLRRCWVEIEHPDGWIARTR